MIESNRRLKELIVDSNNGQNWSIAGVDKLTEQKTTYMTNMSFEQAKKVAEKLAEYFDIDLEIEIQQNSKVYMGYKTLSNR